VRIYRPEKAKLDSVREVRRANPPEPRAETPAAGRYRGPLAAPRGPQEIRVAPRADRAPQTDTRQLEQRERREKQELAVYQAKEKQKIERLYQQEIAKARAQSDRIQVEKRQQDVREALKQDQRAASQQLEARQEVKRRAALAPREGTSQSKVKAADPRRQKKPADLEQENLKREKKNGKDKKGEKRHGEDEKPGGRR
jgi:hypothetical protein